MSYHITDNAFWQNFCKIIQVQKALCTNLLWTWSIYCHTILHNYLPVFRIRKLLLSGELRFAFLFIGSNVPLPLQITQLRHPTICNKIRISNF
jgi:hypothetical protein